MLLAINPYYAAELFVREPGVALILLGAVFLVLTGGEALYADMGHFGRKPIQTSGLAWSCPGLVLELLRQARWCLPIRKRPRIPSSIWCRQWSALAAAPHDYHHRLAGGHLQLYRSPHRRSSSAICRACGAGSPTRSHQGQIYVPFINWLLMIFVLLLVLTFKTAENLAAAYGIAVNITMIVTTAFCWMIAQHRWGRSAAPGQCGVRPVRADRSRLISSDLQK